MSTLLIYLNELLLQDFQLSPFHYDSHFTPGNYWQLISGYNHKFALPNAQNVSTSVSSKKSEFPKSSSQENRKKIVKIGKAVTSTSSNLKKSVSKLVRTLIALHRSLLVNSFLYEFVSLSFPFPSLLLQPQCSAFAAPPFPPVFPPLTWIFGHCSAGGIEAWQRLGAPASAA